MAPIYYHALAAPLKLLKSSQSCAPYALSVDCVVQLCLGIDDGETSLSTLLPSTSSPYYCGIIPLDLLDGVSFYPYNRVSH